MYENLKRQNFNENTEKIFYNIIYYMVVIPII